MPEEHDPGISTATKRHRDDTLYDVFYEIEAYCKAHHFTIFSGGIEEEGLPQAVWDLEEDPHWEHFIDVAEALAVRVMYLNRFTFSEEELIEVISQHRRTHEKQFLEFERNIGMTSYFEVMFLYEGFLHKYLRPSDWYESFARTVALAPLKRPEKV